MLFIIIIIIFNILFKENAYTKKMLSCTGRVDRIISVFFLLSQGSALATLEAAADVQGAATSSGELYIPYRPLHNSCLHCTVCHIEFAP